MNEKKQKLPLTGAIVILSISILFSAYLIADAIRDTKTTHTGNYEYEYQLNRFNENFEELIKTLKED
ncbi:hypothetical protein [Ureibacillus acetophenoni]|uniref:Uncharacterized protein n=1 Tax=Ureibacillus acetophenoni TaxID=614649 RepID=A0A285UI65_9BACL|nr:hypothetical protein [Ureibacillus acetophenoni]SOC41502.1 hypothetical protein SAMN05877842_110113 [Ureibacillus acetophenoni]